MKRYLLDTNILIYYLADEIPLLQLPEIEKMLNHSFRISIITKIELLGWKKQSPEEYIKAYEFIHSAEVYPLKDSIADCAINIRRSYGVSLPDAVIAGTALVHDCILVTRNVRDFSKIHSLSLLNPFDDDRMV